MKLWRQAWSQCWGQVTDGHSTINGASPSCFQGPQGRRVERPRREGGEACMEFNHPPVARPSQPQTLVNTDTRLGPLHCLLHRGAPKGLTPSWGAIDYHKLMVATEGSVIFLGGIASGGLAEKEEERGRGCRTQSRTLCVMKLSGRFLKECC